MIQLIIKKGDRESDKAVRYFKERRIAFQVLNVSEKKLSPKEIDSIIASSSCDDEIIDTSSAFYRKNGYQWREFSLKEELLEHPELLKTPILRCKGKCVFSLDESFIKENSDA